MLRLKYAFIFGAVCTLVLMLCSVACALIWIRSYFVTDWLHIESATVPDRESELQLCSSRGTLAFKREFLDWGRESGEARTQSSFSWNVHAPDISLLAPRDTTCGFAFRHWAHSDSTIGSRQSNDLIVVPHWFLLSATVVYPAYGFLRSRRRAKVVHRLRRGYCPACGYDLRASYDRCPECGATIPADIRRQPLTETKPPAPAPHSDKGNDRDASGS